MGPMLKYMYVRLCVIEVINVFVLG